jgi:hypothetical protein
METVSPNTTTLATANILVRSPKEEKVKGYLVISQKTDGNNEQDKNVIILTVWIWQELSQQLHSWHGKATNLQLDWKVFVNPPEKMEAIWSWDAKEEGNSSLQVAIRDARKGIPIFPWKGNLPQQTDSSGSSFSAFEALKAVHTELANTKAQASNDQPAAAKQEAQLRQAADAYRQTVESLQGQWEKEKKQLLQNFLKVYNARNELLQKQTTQINTLRQELDTAMEDVASSNKGTGTNRQKQLKPMPVELPEDDMEVDETMIEQLEQGLPVQYPKRSGINKKSGTAATATARKGEPRIRANHITGTKEYLGVEAALQDVFGKDKSEESVTDKKKKSVTPSKLPTPRVKQESKDNLSQDIPAGGDESKKTSPETPAQKLVSMTLVPEKASMNPSPPPKSSVMLTKKQRRRRADSSSSSDSSGPVVRRRRDAPKTTPPPKSAIVRRPTAASSSSSSDSDTPRRRQLGKKSAVSATHGDETSSAVTSTKTTVGANGADDSATDDEENFTI